MTLLMGRVGPAFEEPVKHRVKIIDRSYESSLADCYAWVEPLNAYTNLPGVEVPVIDGEFVDVVRCQFNHGVRYLIARQMDDVVASLTEAEWTKHTVDGKIFIFEDINCLYQ